MKKEQETGPVKRSAEAVLTLREDAVQPRCLLEKVRDMSRKCCWLHRKIVKK